MDRFEEQWATENAALANASAAVEAAWNEESTAAQRLREAQSERIHAQKRLHDARKRLENLMAANGINSDGRASSAEHFGRLRLWLIAPLVFLFACGFAGWQTALNVRVCSTSMTDSVARGLVRAYHQFPYHYTLAAADDQPCDVRFNAARSGDAATVIARDGLVAIVNKSNRIRKLTGSELRGIFDGRIRNWSKVGAAPASIIAVVPPDGSDEALAITTFLKRPIGSSVWRSSTPEILKYIASSRGKHAIGFVPFSAAAGAKIVPIAGAAPPTSLSIAHERYPLWVGLMAASDYRQPKAGASGLIAFARSHDAHLLMARADLVTRGVPTELGDRR